MTSTTALAARDITVGYGSRPVLEGVDLEIPDGRITVIVGANASGKSTMLKALARVIAPSGGPVLLDGEPIARMPGKALARRLGLLPQSPVAPEGLSVAELVGFGRHPHRRALGGWSTADTEAVAEALDAAGVAELAERDVDALSGGQRQRAWIAMALAQRTDLLLLDEPTTFLDLAHQVEVLDLLTDLNRRSGTTIALVLHDLNLAARYADHMVAMRHGAVVAVGSPVEVVTEQLVADVFGLDALVMTDPVSGTPLVLPRGRHHVLAR
ncbi:ABC transporter ATP-binding protein [Agrococcus citreus]|uniref:ABC transporter ATP-binding protein n=1 Tax=Agrococcus citreus TaxID=84643 RepID=A0ABP4JMS1_9MICO